jgi:hypothetical protein
MLGANKLMNSTSETSKIIRRSMREKLKLITVATTLVLLLTACSEDVPTGTRNLLPGVEARTNYGFSVDEAVYGLESLLSVVDNALSSGVKFKDIDFDILNDLSPEVAVLPGEMNITMLGGAATVVAVSNSGKYIIGAAYGDSGFCLYMKITEGRELKIERGIGFSIDCNAEKISDSITWSLTETFPGVDKVEMPEGNITSGEPNSSDLPNSSINNESENPQSTTDGQVSQVSPPPTRPGAEINK